MTKEYPILRKNEYFLKIFSKLFVAFEEIVYLCSAFKLNLNKSFNF